MAKVITQMRLKQLFSYDAASGIFTRIATTGPNSRIGQAAGWSGGNGRIYIKIDGASYQAHRLAWLYVHGEFPEADIDHINMDPQDNKISNLRCATRSQNNANKERTQLNKSGFKGVNFHKASNKFIAQISHQGKKLYLGIFNTPEEASAIYKNRAEKLFGEFSRG
jgi:hypothetical protein